MYFDRMRRSFSFFFSSVCIFISSLAWHSFNSCSLKLSLLLTFLLSFLSSLISFCNLKFSFCSESVFSCSFVKMDDCSCENFIYLSDNSSFSLFKVLYFSINLSESVAFDENLKRKWLFSGKKVYTS